MQGETMVYIMTTNLTMKKRLPRVGVGGNGLRRIRVIIIPIRPTTCSNICLLPLIEQNMMRNHSQIHV
jgi:hypothetical protein